MTTRRAPIPTDEITAGVEAAHRRLLVAIEALGCDELDEPSTLPGWRRREVIGHLTANADAVRRVLEGASEDRLPAKYPGGPDGRDRIIAGLAQLPRARLVERARQSADRLTATMAGLTERAWGRPTRLRDDLVPAWRSAWLRWLEVEIHHLDLALTRTLTDVPEPLVLDALRWSSRHLADRLPARITVELVIRDMPTAGTHLGTADESADRVVEGDGRDVLWWLLRPEHADRSRLFVHDGSGTPAALPRLRPYG